MNTRHYYLRLLRTFALATLTAAAVAACSDDTDNDREPLTPPDGADGIPVTFTANINPGSDAAPAGAPGTRTVLTPTDGGGFTVTWKGQDSPDGTDRILIWAAKGNTLTNVWGKTYVPTTSAASSELVPQDDSEKLTLTSADTWKFTAIYGSSSSGEGTAAVVLKQRSQSAPNDTKEIARWDFSIATAEQYVAADNEMPRNISLGFKHMLSAMQLHVTNETGAELTVREIRLSAAGGQITYQKAYDVARGDWKADQERKSDYLKLEIENPAALATGGAFQDFHMLFFPGYANTDMTITVVTDRGEFTLTKTAPASPGFQAGKNYMTNIAIKSNPGTGETWSEHVGISTADDLAAFCSQVNGGDNYQGKTVRLLNNITLTGTWTPIGTDGKPFSGTFDGGGYSISGLNVDTGSEGYAGLFGYIIGGTVHNLRVSGTVTGTGWNTGGIAGKLGMNSTVENCIFSGTVNGGNDNVNGDRAGGIAGESDDNSQITGCYTSGTVKAVSAGGIIGKNGGSINDCYSSAMVEGTGVWGAGGIVGGNASSSVTRCYSTGAISGETGVGGIVGVNNTQWGGDLKNCIALNPSLTRTSGSTNWFGRITSQNTTFNNPITNCGAFAGMTLPDGITATPAADGIHGADLSREQCVTEATYTDREFTTANGWGFDTGVTWTYLPWNKAFENFHSLYPRDYRISVPDHLKAPVIN